MCDHDDFEYLVKIEPGASNVSPVLIWSGYPVIRNPLFSFQYVTPAMQTVLIHFPQPATLFVHEMIVPHDRGPLPWTDH